LYVVGGLFTLEILFYLHLKRMHSILQI